MRIVLKIVIGTGIFFGAFSFFFLFTGNWEGFFATLVVGPGFIGLGWAGRRLEITSAFKGVDYAAQFEIPVFNQDKECAG